MTGRRPKNTDSELKKNLQIYRAGANSQKRSTLVVGQKPNWKSKANDQVLPSMAVLPSPTGSIEGHLLCMQSWESPAKSAELWRAPFSPRSNQFVPSCETQSKDRPGRIAPAKSR